MQRPAWRRGWSRRSRRPVALLATLLPACGPGVHDLTDEAGPLVEVSGRIEGSLAAVLPPPTAAEDLRLRAGLLWAGNPFGDPYCLEHGPNPVRRSGEPPSPFSRQVCPADPLGFRPALMDVSVPVDPASPEPFVIPLTHVPSAEVMVGTLEARVAYASLVLFHDVNDNGTLDLIEPRDLPRDRRGGGGGPGGGRDDPSKGKEDGPPDELLGASFSSLLRPQVRVVFREGDFVESFFWPLPDCDPPPKGFSVLTVEGTFLGGSCTAAGLEEGPVPVPLARPETLADLRCLPPQGRKDARPRDELPEGWLSECLGPEELVTADPKAECPAISEQVLAGCQGDARCVLDCETDDCEAPDWDRRDNPPDWWPCGDAEEPSE